MPSPNVCSPSKSTFCLVKMLGFSSQIWRNGVMQISEGGSVIGFYFQMRMAGSSEVSCRYQSGECLQRKERSTTLLRATSVQSYDEILDC